MEKAVIKFLDGTEIEVDKSSECYVTDEVPEIPEELALVRITSEQGERIVRNAEFVECASVDGRYWFTFIETPEIDRRLTEIEDALCDLSKE